jgi:hypothetical protein
MKSYRVLLRVCIEQYSSAAFLRRLFREPPGWRAANFVILRIDRPTKLFNCRPAGVLGWSGLRGALRVRRVSFFLPPPSGPGWASERPRKTPNRANAQLRREPNSPLPLSVPQIQRFALELGSLGVAREWAHPVRV